uniref:Haustellum specific protein A n=1 Tax=Sarcophaga peregrina TaxID=7386 RepID=Q9NL63_SARPE|nr:haustellum specific protein A [Sarcophaga peregrina]
MSLKLRNIIVILSFITLKLVCNVSGATTVIGDKNYQVIITAKLNWHKAYQACAKLGMSLASIESETENKSLKDYLYSQSILANQFWLSGTNLADKSTYSWQSTGKPMTFTQWAPNQPGTLANRCTYMNFNGQWVTDSCYAKKYFICSQPVTPICGASGSCTSSFQLEF